MISETTTPVPSRFDRLRSYIQIPYRDDAVFSIIFFLALFLPLLFVPLLKEGYETPKFALFLLGAGAAVAFFALVNDTFTKTFRSKYFVWGFLLFYSLVILSSVFSMDWRNALFGTVGRSSNSLVFMLALGAYFLVVLYKLTKDRLMFLLNILVFGGALMGLYGILQHEGYGFYAGLNPTTRLFIPSFLGNPNFTSMYLSMIVPVAMYLLVIAGTVRAKIWYIAALVLMIWGIAQSSSRAAILALFVSLVGILLYALFVKTYRKYLFWTAISIVFALALSYISFTFFRPDNINQSIQFQDSTQQYRLVVWDLSLEMIKERPLLGTGFSNYYIAFKEFGWSPFSSGERFDDAHNVFLNLAANAGLPVALIFTAFLVWVLYLGLYKLRDEPLNVFLSAGIIAWIVGALFGPVVVACWVVLALLSAGILYSQVWRQAEIKQPIPVKYGLVVFGVLIALCGGIVIYSHILNQLASKAYNANDFEKSLRYSEYNWFGNLINTDSNRFLINSRIRLGKPADETAAILESLLKTRDNSSTAHLNAATVYYMLWQQSQDSSYLQKMEAAMERSVALEKNYSGIYAQIGYLWFKAGNPEKALANQHVALTLNPNQFYGWVLLARLHYDRGEKDQFLAAFEKAYLADPSSLLLKYTLQQYRQTDDIKSIPFPVFFPEVESLGGT